MVLPDGGEVWNSRSGSFLAARAPLGSGFLFVARRLPADFLAIQQCSDANDCLRHRKSAHSHLQTANAADLSLFTILLLFSATWFALFLSKEVTVPIQALAEATHEIAAGRFDTHVKVKARTSWERWFAPSTP